MYYSNDAEDDIKRAGVVGRCVPLLSRQVQGYRYGMVEGCVLGDKSSQDLCRKLRSQSDEKQ